MSLLNGFILAFHDIAPQRLCELVEAMKPAQAVPLTELVDRSKRHKSTSGLFAITVDDGVGETVRSLAQIFRSRGWPGTFYIPTQYLDSGEAMPFQYFRQMLPWLPRRRMLLQGRILDLAAPNALQGLSKEMERMWHTERRERYVPFILELAEIAKRENGLTIADLHLPQPITWQEVAVLSRDQMISFESHGVSHTAMSSMTENELIFEMKYSQERISEHTGQRCRHLAYPFGSTPSIGSLAVVAASRYYDSAVTMSLGPVDSANPWLLPRIPLYTRNSPLFAWAKILMKCCKGSYRTLRKEIPLEAKADQYCSAAKGK